MHTAIKYFKLTKMQSGKKPHPEVPESQSKNPHQNNSTRQPKMSKITKTLKNSLPINNRNSKTPSKFVTHDHNTTIPLTEEEANTPQNHSQKH